MPVTKSLFGTAPEGEAHLFTLTNDNGITVAITNYGGIITRITTPDRQGNEEDVALGFDNLDDYLEDELFLGATVGRYANRISGASFSLEGKTYKLFANAGEHHLHGGVKGFHKQLWDAEPFETDSASGVKMRYTSPDGEEGYPGTLDVTVTFSLTVDNELVIEYEAATDKTTVVNLTNHTYFNLHDGGETEATSHLIKIHADQMVEANESLCPTGTILSVDGKPFDFREGKLIEEEVESSHPQIMMGNGFDHSFVVNGEPGTLRPAAEAYDPQTGRMLEVFTEEPVVHFYSGNFLDGTITGRDGVVYGNRNAFCFETQHFADSPNQPDFPSTVLRPGEKYQTKTVYKFTTE